MTLTFLGPFPKIHHSLKGFQILWRILMKHEASDKTINYQTISKSTYLATYRVPEKYQYTTQLHTCGSSERIRNNQGTISWKRGPRIKWWSKGRGVVPPGRIYTGAEKGTCQSGRPQILKRLLRYIHTVPISMASDFISYYLKKKKKS
jgi:hypothetical protein